MANLVNTNAIRVSPSVRARERVCIDDSKKCVIQRIQRMPIANAHCLSFKSSHSHGHDHLFKKAMTELRYNFIWCGVRWKWIALNTSISKWCNQNSVRSRAPGLRLVFFWRSKNDSKVRCPVWLCLDSRQTLSTHQSMCELFVRQKMPNVIFCFWNEINKNAIKEREREARRTRTCWAIQELCAKKTHRRWTDTASGLVAISGRPSLNQIFFAINLICLN